MRTITKTDTDTSPTPRWRAYFSALGQALDFDSQAYTDLSLRQLRQTVTTLEARLAELEACTAYPSQTDTHELNEKKVPHG